jgi:hypothetical protein
VPDIAQQIYVLYLFAQFLRCDLGSLGGSRHLDNLKTFNIIFKSAKIAILFPERLPASAGFFTPICKHSPLPWSRY